VPDGIAYAFAAELWRWESRRELWTFVSVPADLSAEIAENTAGLAGGFGSLAVEARIGGSRFRTSIFPSGDGTYALPVKRAVREAEGVGLGDRVEVELALILA
jgi:hypothetical protein